MASQSIPLPRRRGLSSPALARIARTGRRIADRPLLVVGALFVVSAGLAAYYATKITSFQPDELGYTHLAMALGDSPTLFTGAFNGHERLNQLYPLTLAPLYALFDNVTAYQLAHWWNALLMGSAVIPVYLLAREVVERRSVAYMAAAVAAVVPWLTLSSSLLTEVVAYPTCAWALFAMQRSLTRPSPRADLLALGLIGLATYGRLQLGILGPLWVGAVLLHELGWALTGGAARTGRARALREARGRILRDHVVLVVVTALGLAALAVLVARGGLQQAFGIYGGTLSGELFPPGTWANARANLTFLMWGLGVLPMVMTIGLVLENVAAPRVRQVHAFAVLAGLTVLVIVVTAARVNVIFISGAVQERYVFFVVPLLVVGLLAGLFGGRRPALTLLLGAAVVAPLAATTDHQVVLSSFWWLVSPGMSWFLEVIAPRLGQVGGLVGAGDVSRFALGGYAIALGCVLLAVALGLAGRRRALVAGGATAVVVLFCATATVYSFRHVVYGSSEYKGLAPVVAGDRNWIDRAVGRDTPVTMLATQLGQVSDSHDRWWSLEFWNRSVDTAYALSRPDTTWHTSQVASVRGGRVDGPRPARYVVLSTSGLPLGLAGREIARSPDRRLRLVDTGNGALRAAWTVSGVSDDGWLPWQRPARLTILGRRTGCRAVSFVFVVPSGLPESRTVRLRGSGLDRTVVVHPRQARGVGVRACGAGPLRLTLSALVPATASAPGVTIRLRSVSVAAA